MLLLSTISSMKISLESCPSIVYIHLSLDRYFPIRLQQSSVPIELSLIKILLIHKDWYSLYINDSFVINSNDMHRNASFLLLLHLCVYDAYTEAPCLCSLDTSCHTILILWTESFRASYQQYTDFKEKSPIINNTNKISNIPSNAWHQNYWGSLMAPSCSQLKQDYIIMNRVFRWLTKIQLPTRFNL